MKHNQNSSQDEAVNLSYQEDLVLMAKIAARDTTSFNQLYKKYVGLMYNTINSVTNDHYDTEDVIQEVLTQIWNKCHLYEPSKGKPITWVTTLAKNRAIDRVRSKQRRFRLSEDFGKQVVTYNEEYEQSAVDKIMSEEKKLAVLKAMNNLTSDQREAISLNFFTDMTQNEVADRLKEPLGTIKARIRRGISRLENIYRDQYDVI
jgi:RNA polymerase sigma-70 factor (ECF subfamily)